MAVFAIVGVLTSITLFSITFKKYEKYLITATRETASAIREVQNYSLTGKTTVDGIRCCAYEFWAHDADYILSCLTEDGGTCDTGGDLLGHYNLNNGVQFKEEYMIRFYVPHANSSIGEKYQITLAKDNFFGEEKNSYVCVYNTGRVEEGACP